MTRSHLTTFTLLGALVGSLALNVRQATGGAAPGAREPETDALACGVIALESGDLTEEQRDAVRACCATCCGSATETARLLRERCARLASLLCREERPDREEAEALADQVCDLLRRVLRGRLDAVFKVREVLTPEQLRRLSGG